MLELARKISYERKTTRSAFKDNFLGKRKKNKKGKEIRKLQPNDKQQDQGKGEDGNFKTLQDQYKRGKN